MDSQRMYFFSSRSFWIATGIEQCSTVAIIAKAFFLLVIYTHAFSPFISYILARLVVIIIIIIFCSSFLGLSENGKLLTDDVCYLAWIVWLTGNNNNVCHIV